jgi:hypothetical protein
MFVSKTISKRYVATSLSIVAECGCILEAILEGDVTSEHGQNFANRIGETVERAIDEVWQSYVKSNGPT